MKTPPPNLNRLLGATTGVLLTIFYFVTIVVLKQPASGPYPYWWSIAGSMFLTFLPIKFADTDPWPGFALGLFGFLVSLMMISTLVMGN